MEDNIQYYGSRISGPQNFGMIIPKGPYKPPPETFFKLYKECGYYHFCIRWRYPEWLDKLLKLLCRFGRHRWVATFGFRQYSISDFGTSEAKSSGFKREDNYQCPRCKKTKAVNRT